MKGKLYLVESCANVLIEFEILFSSETNLKQKLFHFELSKAREKFEMAWNQKCSRALITKMLSFMNFDTNEKWREFK